MTKKTKKTKRSGERVVDSTTGRADPGDDRGKSSADLAKPVYLVGPALSGQPASSLFMVEAAAVLADPPRARTVAGIQGARHGMSFVATYSKQGSWIVGVGGPGGKTVIYDPSSTKTSLGPDLNFPKHQPFLISVDSKVYAIARRPKVYNTTKFDFVPWFESLSFREGVPGNCGPTYRGWKALRPPPFLPYYLDPLEYRNPPNISISSCAAVGSHILLSPDGKETGTYAFHVVEETWEKICNDNLPFVGQAVALGGGLVAACCTIHNVATAAAVFHISINKGSSTTPVKLTTRLLWIHLLASTGDPPLPLLSPVGKGSFCCIKLGVQASHEGNYLDALQIILTAFKIYNVEAVLTACQTDPDGLEVPVQLHHQNQTYTLEGRFPFKNSRMPVIASISMDKELAEPFEVERSKKRARKAINIFEAAMTSRA